jgi:hypothetical protein
MSVENKKKGILKNKLLRYKLILECYLEHKTDDIPTTVVHRKYIYPKYFISRTTLYTILGTPVNKLLKELEKTD